MQPASDTMKDSRYGSRTLLLLRNNLRVVSRNLLSSAHKCYLFCLAYI